MTCWQMWHVIAGGALTVFVLRLSFLALLRPDRLPRWTKEVLGLIPAALLAALVTPAILPQAVGGGADAPRALAAGAAALVAWRSASVALTIGSGLLTLWVFRWLL